MQLIVITSRLIAVTSTGRVAIDICDKSHKQVITYQLNVSCHQELADIAFTSQFEFISFF